MVFIILFNPKKVPVIFWVYASLEVTGGVTWIIGCEHQYACEAMREKATGEVGKNENN